MCSKKVTRNSVPNFFDGFSPMLTWCHPFNSKLKLSSKHLASIPQSGGSASSCHCSDFHTSNRSEGGGSASSCHYSEFRTSSNRSEGGGSASSRCCSEFHTSRSPRVVGQHLPAIILTSTHQEYGGLERGRVQETQSAGC